MPTVKLSPLFNDEQLDNNGLPLSGGKINWYLAGTSTPATTYTDSAGTVAQANPVVLNSRGEPANPIWLPISQSYKAVLSDSLSNIIRTIDNISGVNDIASLVSSEWILYSGVATYINATSFSISADVTATLTIGRRIKAAVTGGTVYANVVSSVFAAGITTVTVSNDSVALDSGLSAVYYGIADPIHDSLGLSATLRAQTHTAYTTGGSSGTFTLSPVPGISSLTAGQRFRVKFSAAGNGSDTLAVSGLTAKNLKQYNNAGAISAPVIASGQLADVEYDGTQWVVLDALPILQMVAAGTAQASTSGTSIDFTAIPSGTNRISIQFVDVSTNGSANLRVRLGTGGSAETSGYLGAAGIVAPSVGGISANYSAGFDLNEATGASAVRQGSLVLSHLGSNKWTIYGLVTQSDTTRTSLIAGSKTLAGVLDMIRITTSNGTDAFDAGSINILYE